MSIYIGLLRREWLEHRSGYFIGVSSLLILLLLASVMVLFADSKIDLDLGNDEVFEWQNSIQGGDGSESDSSGEGSISSSSSSRSESLSHMHRKETRDFAPVRGFDVAGKTDAEMKEGVGSLLDAVALPFHWVFILTTLFALASCLFDERKDNSILFWKSLPVNDVQTVASKLVFLLWLAPVIFIIGIFVAHLMVLGVATWFVEDGMGSRVWGASGLLIRPFSLFFAYVVQGLWFLPLVGWVMLVSATAKRNPIFFAIGIPLLASIFEMILFNSSYLSHAIGEHMQLVALPLGKLGEVQMGDAAAVLGLGSLWAGVVVGFGFLAGTIYCRGRYNEI